MARIIPFRKPTMQSVKLNPVGSLTASNVQDAINEIALNTVDKNVSAELTNKTFVDPIIQYNGSSGLPGQVLTSQGPGMPYTWAPLEDSFFKVGDVIFSAVELNSSKWVKADDRRLLKSEYPELFAAVGYRSGSSRGDIWALRSAFFNTSTVTDIASGNGIVVIGGAHGGISISSNMVDWTPTASPFNREGINSIAFGNGKFVAISSTGIAWSTNGITWTLASHNTALYIYFKRVRYVNGKFYVLSGSDEMLESSDGITWTLRTLTYSAHDIAYGNGKYLIVTNSTISLTSTNGTSWTSQTTIAAKSAVFGNGRFVIGTGAGAISSSSDCVTWSSHTSGFSTTAIVKIDYCSNLFVAVGNSGIVSTSSDGMTWTVRDVGLTTQVNAAVFFNNYYMVCGSYGAISYSSNLTTWTLVERSSMNTTKITGIAANNDLFVIVGENGKLCTNIDTSFLDTRLQYCNFGHRNINSVTYGNGLFVIAGDNGQLSTSPDGESWTARTSGFGTSSISFVKFVNNTMFFAASTIGAYATSTTGTTWTQRTSPFGADPIKDIAYGNGMYVAVSTQGKLATSVTGTSWTLRSPVFTSGSCAGIAYGNGMFISANSGGTYATSTDGVTWFQRLINDIAVTTVTQVAFVSGSFMIGSNTGTLLISNDGLSWKNTQPEADVSITGIEGSTTVVVATADLGSIMVCKLEYSEQTHFILPYINAGSSIAYYRAKQ